MNKSIAFLILGVILLAMALIMVNQYASQQTSNVAETAFSPAPPMPQTPPPAAAAPLPAPVQPEEIEKRPAPDGGVSGHAPQSSPPDAAFPPRRTTETPPASSSPSPAHGADAEQPDRLARTHAAEAAHKEPAASTKPARSAPPPAETPSPAPAKAASAKPMAPKTIKKIAVRALPEGANVVFEALRPVEYKSMQLTGPDRLVMDFPGEWAVKAPGVPANKFVSNVRIGKQADKTRVVIDLRQKPASIVFMKRGAEAVEVRIR